MQTNNEKEDERMNVIAQNGNDGLHYEMSRVKTLLKYKDDMIDEVEEEVREEKCPV